MMQSNNSNHHSFHHHHHHLNGIMTAPRPRQQSSGFGASVPRKNLFSPGPAQTNQLVHHHKENAGNHHHHHLPHPPMSRTPMKQHHYSISNGEAAVTTPMKHQYGHAAPLATPERTPRRNITTAITTTTTTPSRHHQQQQQQQQQQYCGLSAMISMETSYRTPSKSTSKKQHRRSPMIFHTTATPMSVTSTAAADAVTATTKDVAVSTTKKKHHKRGASLLTPMSLVTASSSSMMKPAATTTKKHKRSNTSSLMFTLSTPTTTTTAAASATPMRMDNTTLEEVGVLNLKQDLFGVLPNTDTKLMYPTSSMNRHRRYQHHQQRLMTTPQMNMFEMDDVLSSSSSSSASSGVDEDDNEVKEEQRVMPAPPTTSTATPKQKLRRTIPLPSPNLSVALSGRKKLKKQLTPPRQYYSSHAVDIDSKPDMLGLVGTGFEGMDNYRLTSTELDPSDFQIDLPTKKEILVHAQICKLMNGYTMTQRDFNFAMLSGITRTTLEKEYDKSITSDDNMIAGSCHRDVVKEVLDCADDLVVEGFFREYGGGSGSSNNNRDENKEGSGGGTGERIEACVFSSESLRQIIVCFRGSTAAQARPVRSNLLFGRDASSILDDEKQKVGILNSFQSAYFSTSLEKALSFLLANLAARKPFFDVVMTGHSFGGAMATIASLRYAMGNSQMRVICHTFGSPRIGGEEWRQLVHSIPNLRIYRVEKAHDSFVTMPTGNEWVHCGHSIQILGEEETSVQFAAHRFDRAAPNASLSHTLQKVATEPVRVLRSASKVVSIPIQGTSSTNGKDAIEAYVDKLRSSGDCWFTEFSGMKGEGVSGMNNEMRTLA